MADTSAQAGLADWGPLLGAGAGALTNYLGNSSAVNAATSGENSAIGTQTGLQGQLTGIYGGQRGLGTGADSALAAQLGLNGTPDFAAFQNSPGFQGSLALGNQAITRAASANGSLYTPNMLNELGQYDTTYASQNYNNYISQLMQSAGLGASGNQGLASGISSSGNNISQLQQNRGNLQAGGNANATGIVSNLLGKVPWGQVATGAGSLFGGSNSSGVGDFGAGSSDTTNGQYNGGAFGGGAPLYDSGTGGYPTGTTATGTDWFNSNPQ
jgi:hypothetical protein